MRGCAVGDGEGTVAAILRRVMTGISNELSPVFGGNKFPARPLPVERVRVTTAHRSLIREVCDGIVTFHGEPLGGIDGAYGLCLRYLAGCSCPAGQRNQQKC